MLKGRYRPVQLPKNLFRISLTHALNKTDLLHLILVACLSEGSDGHCWASKLTLAEELGITPRRLQNSKIKLKNTKLVHDLGEKKLVPYWKIEEKSSEFFITFRHEWWVAIEKKLTTQELNLMACARAFPLWSRQQLCEGLKFKHINNVSTMRAKLVRLGLVQVCKNGESRSVKTSPKDILSEYQRKEAKPESPDGDVRRESATSITNGDALPLIHPDTNTTPTPTATEFARRLHAKWKSTASARRAGRGIHVQFPRKVWPAAMNKFLKTDWSGGDTAFAFVFERLMNAWDALPDKVLPWPARLYSGGESYYYIQVLLPALDKLDAKSLVLPDRLKHQWARVRSLNWPGDKQDVLACLVQTDATLTRVRKAVNRLAVPPGLVPVPGTKLHRQSKRTPVQVAAHNMTVFMPQLEAAKLLTEFFKTAGQFAGRDGAKFNYPRLTLTPDSLLAHKTFSPYLLNACRNLPFGTAELLAAEIFKGCQ